MISLAELPVELRKEDVLLGVALDVTEERVEAGEDSVVAGQSLRGQHVEAGSEGLDGLLTGGGEEFSGIAGAGDAGKVAAVVIVGKEAEEAVVKDRDRRWRGRPGAG